MELYLFSNAFVFVCALVGFIIGISIFFKPKKAVYAQMITLATGCITFGRLYQVVRMLTGGEIIDEFQLGVLGVIGSLLFLFSANFGLMDSLADDGSKRFKKYRIIPLAAPLAALLACVLFIVFADVSLISKIETGVITVFVMQASYYHLKHLIFPDVDYGVINCLKPYNLLALLYSCLCLLETVAVSLNNMVLTAISNVITGFILIGIVISVERGIKKWST